MKIDAQTISEIKKGNQAVFEAVFKTYYARLCVFAQSFLGDRDEAEDIVEDFFVDLWEQRQSLTIHTSFNAYVYRAVKNRCLNYIKHLSVRDKYKETIRRHYQELPLVDKPNQGHEIDWHYLQQCMQETLQQLPPQAHRVFLMSRFEEKTYEEIGAELGISRNTVKKHMMKALLHLRKALKEFLPLLLIWLMPG